MEGASLRLPPTGTCAHMCKHMCPHTHIHVPTHMHTHIYTCAHTHVNSHLHMCKKKEGNKSPVLEQTEKPKQKERAVQEGGLGCRCRDGGHRRVLINLHLHETSHSYFPGLEAPSVNLWLHLCRSGNTRLCGSFLSQAFPQSGPRDCPNVT